MPLEPRLRPILALARLNQEAPDTPMAVRRANSARVSKSLGGLGMRPGPEPSTTIDRAVPVDGGQITVRIYTPPGTGPFPLYVFLHGGGWCIGNIDERNPRCRAVAAGAQCVVASVDYRLAPENQFPTGFNDCYQAMVWLIAHAHELNIDPSKIAIGGESAGANLAAAVCLRARDENGPSICHQWLDVPATDATMSQSGYREVADGYLLDRALLDLYFDHYLPDPALRTDPSVSPLLAASHAGLPSAWIMSAEFDRLRGDAVAYADALRAAGVPVEHTRLDGHVHASFALTRLLPSSRAYEEAAIAALARAFRSAPE